MRHVQASETRTSPARTRPTRAPGPALGAKPRWYLPVALLVDVLVPGISAAVLVRPAAAPLRSWATAALLASVAWPAVRLFRNRYASRALGESRGTLPVLHDWLVLLGVLAIVRVAADLRQPAALCLAALVPPLVATLLTRKLTYRHLMASRREAQAVIRVLVVGEPGAADEVAGQLASRTDHPFVVVGVVAVGQGPQAGGVPMAARLADRALAAPDEDAAAVLAAARARGADLALVASSALLYGERLRRLSWGMHDAGLELALVPGLVDVSVKRLETGSAAGMALLRIAPPLRHGVQPALKHALDRVAAALGMLLLSPLLLAIALAVRLGSPGPVLYRHERIGRGGAPFTMWKFRTMVAGADARKAELAGENEQDGPVFKMRCDPRVTRVGGLLRRTSLDELPQLANVLRGEMSLVGPRPPLAEEVAHYTAVERRRLAVRPGMTGLWQVGGRSDLSWDEAVQLDLSYVDNWSFTSDLDVMTRTVRAVVDGRGAY
ncbi:exopolysaccharide biosynthesis polyprenyl glycosylphosphotransferase [Streptomyces sp. TS71-3]|uniref:exopolysaccharide biosynthesis polyprenyl glycosylphosphotransferase n=1 Tax=Streptomyces sp. TS71-3 TaxID=2733862 RepID=UPI001B1589C2|nr:exopolysaccharide biosynthesis polyprenyl glycosylphosphotransferase [Streptomyces sp. TS71-3]GHJ42040.1 exopolysaccharide biosynthesis polyprenyl glycosylphosphotransferase [Streptomyces sp. TS71-3]